MEKMLIKLNDGFIDVCTLIERFFELNSDLIQSWGGFAGASLCPILGVKPGQLP